MTLAKYGVGADTAVGRNGFTQMVAKVDVGMAQAGSSGNRVANNAVPVPAPARAVDGVDRVVLSAGGYQLSRPEDRSSRSAVDEKRVAAIRSALAKGEYKVDPSKVAEKMISFEQELSGD